ncbi:hypothetical protein D8796_02880 [Streptococcus cristatus]|jgi:hypothetical protein|uniref:Uncharacterized protein n=1 Tax=Streptococcus cristatus TaxID=45634 RepID=A0A428GVJ2_STRCR|nr:hypothetical protein [Streptococcus cristatus]RSJ81602.1 hypothetical protein D8796_02880 [Streptococcus cristatus]RSJ81996.1 hypothetical protein D8795_01905 [Streptococcus cristatus]RSJ87061.1 hypothetical protein D8793_04305 [Streptococcus cristatus]RSJ87082.1 hypothetical protein D8794_02380 [Streptococcus cristatus]
MGFDEIMGNLRNQRAKIEEDFKEYKQDYDRREEDLERADYLYRNMFEENMNQLRLALNVFEPDSILLGQVCQEYQESSEQVQWFINQKRSDLMEEFSEHKRQYQRNLDNNEEQMHHLQRRNQ